MQLVDAVAVRDHAVADVGQHDDPLVGEGLAVHAERREWCWGDAQLRREPFDDLGLVGLVPWAALDNIGLQRGDPTLPL